MPSIRDREEFLPDSGDIQITGGDHGGSNTMYKVIVIDDETLVRRGIVMETDWQALDCVVVAEAGQWDRRPGSRAEIPSGSADLRYPYAPNGRHRDAEGAAGRRQ